MTEQQPDPSGIDPINPDGAREAVEILNTHPAAEPEWGAALNAVITGEPKFRDQVWAGVRAALGGLDVAAVRGRFDPARGADFDVVSFLREKGTLYLLAKENDPASRLLAALIADIVRVAKQLADASPGARLDPPLTLMLDEVANFARLPDLPAYISAYGGSGIVTFAWAAAPVRSRRRTISPGLASSTSRCRPGATRSEESRA